MRPKLSFGHAERDSDGDMAFRAAGRDLPFATGGGGGRHEGLGGGYQISDEVGYDHSER